MPPRLGNSQYSIWVGLVYVYNLVVGTGALTLPAMFALAGWGVGIVTVVMLAFMGFITVTFVVELIACSNATLVESHRIDDSENTDTPEEEEGEAEVTETTPAINRPSNRHFTLDRQVELGEMSYLYFNKLGQFLFYVALCFYLYGDLTIYVTAIGKTLCDMACSNNNSSTEDFSVSCWKNNALTKMDVYRIFVLTFMLLAGPFTYFNLQKTKYLQLFTSSLRWIAFIIMIALAATRISQHGAQGHPPVGYLPGVPPLIGASVYSFMSHHSLPNLIPPFREKKHIVKLLGLDYALICVFYLLLAMTGVFAFQHVEDLYTLNFVPSSDDHNILLKVTMYFLTAFPVFTLSTSFPIIALTLQDNLKCVFLDVHNISRYHFVLRRLTFPTLAIIPPAVIALSTHNLGILVEITGIYAGTSIQYIIPAVLVLCARRACRSHRRINRYASPFQGSVWIVFVILWAALCMILATLNHMFKHQIKIY